MQITIQKKFIFLIEVAENIYRAFLIIVNFVFNFVDDIATESVDIINIQYVDFKKKVDNGLEIFRESFNNFQSKTFNFVRALFGFNIYKLKVLRINNKNLSLNNYDNSIRHFNNQNNRVRYSNLLAPPFF